MISIFGPPSRRVKVKNEIGKLRGNCAVRNETQREMVGSWKLWIWSDISNWAQIWEMKHLWICAVPYSFTHPIFPTLQNYIHYPIDAFPIHDRLHQCVSAFSFGDDGRRGDRLFSPRNDAQQATRLPHCSVERDHDALNERCTLDALVCTCVEKQTSSVNIFCKHMCSSSTLGHSMCNNGPD